MGRKANGYWTVEKVLGEGKKYKTKKEFSDENESAYKVSLKRSWIDEFFPEILNKKKVDQLNLEGNYIKTFDSISEAIKETGLTSIWSACNGRQESTGGYKWRYHED